MPISFYNAVILNILFSPASFNVHATIVSFYWWSIVAQNTSHSLAFYIHHFLLVLSLLWTWQMIPQNTHYEYLNSEINGKKWNLLYLIFCVHSRSPHKLNCYCWNPKKKKKYYIGYKVRAPSASPSSSNNNKKNLLKKHQERAWKTSIFRL